MSFKKYLLLSIIMLATTFIAIGQDRAEVGLALGFSQSGTDTHSWGNDGESIFAKTNLMFGINGLYRISSNLDLRVNWFLSSIEGDDNDVLGHEWRGYSFTSSLQEISLDLKWNFWDNYPKENPDQLEQDFNSLDKKLFAFYISGGVGLSFTNPDVTYGTTPNEAERLLDAGATSNTNLQIPIGAGVNYQMTNRLNLDLEMRSVIPMTDLLDGMSEVVNPDNNDSYLFALLRLNYSLKNRK